MSTILPKAASAAQRILGETPKPAMARATLDSRTLHDKRAEYGKVLRRTREIAGMTRDQAADALHVDPAQVSRFESGDEPQPTWRYRQHPTLRLAYMEAQAEDLEKQTSRVKARLVIEIAKAE